ncbi:MAG TPA: MATE family efflux transporter, partial [Cyclobacteriaceae bacterium]|nr:MATE family efflux transporter [Cyclobacteriaceae bacterium]
VMPISFFISSVGMAIGIGGSSIISRALGSKNGKKAQQTYGNMIRVTVALSIVFVILSFIFSDNILHAFGGKGDILPLARDYFRIIIIGIPFLTWGMMANNIIRAEGKPKYAMLVLMIPAIANIFLDALFIVYLGWGLKGAAWATTISYALSAAYALGYFISGKSEMKLESIKYKISIPILKEIISLGFVTLARQSSISLLILVLNHTLFQYGGESAISVYGIISRLMMFTLFPVMGLVQGFVPIAGYNYGAELWDRVKYVVNSSIKYGVILSFIIFLSILVGAQFYVKVFTDDLQLLAQAPAALRIAFLATPFIAVQLIGTAYFQAIGKAVPALILSLTKQGFCLIPLVLILPIFFGIEGVWYSFPLADIASTLITWFVLRKELSKQSEPALIRLQDA